MGHYERSFRSDMKHRLNLLAALEQIEDAFSDLAGSRRRSNLEWPNFQLTILHFDVGAFGLASFRVGVPIHSTPWIDKKPDPAPS